MGRDRFLLWIGERMASGIWGSLPGSLSRTEKGQGEEQTVIARAMGAEKIPNMGEEPCQL